MTRPLNTALPLRGSAQICQPFISSLMALDAVLQDSRLCGRLEMRSVYRNNLDMCKDCQIRSELFLGLMDVF